MSWKAEVVADETGNWIPNGLRFGTEKEAMAYVVNLAIGWSAVRDLRVITSNDPVNSCWNGKLETLNAQGNEAAPILQC
jgi:hypothetical protein